MKAHARRRIHSPDNGYTPRATVCLCPSCIAGAPERAAMRRREIEDVRRRSAFKYSRASMLFGEASREESASADTGRAPS